jgi:HK97 family phage major capsid protein
MSDETAMTLRKLKDADGNPLWNHSNNTIFGKEVVISPYMEDAEKPIIFGDLTYFWMIIRKPLAVSVLNERYAETNDIGYIANERLDSKLVRSNANQGISLLTRRK